MTFACFCAPSAASLKKVWKKFSKAERFDTGYPRTAAVSLLQRREPQAIDTPPTPLTQIRFRGRIIHVKRDDVLEFAGVTGSKLRKFYSLLQAGALANNDCLVSYGGAQSNAMLALSLLSQHHSKPFVYITRPIPERLSTNQGNFKRAIDAGMIHVQVDHRRFAEAFTDKPPRLILPVIHSILETKRFAFPTETPLFIPQGGAWEGAEMGLKKLAGELREQINALRLSGSLARKKPILFLPSGTGTTAFYLQKHLGDIVRVVTVPVSGDERYLIKQMRWLNLSSSQDERLMQTPVLPDVVRPRLRGTFADVRLDKLTVWKELQRSTCGDFEFDLIYAPKAWEEVMLAVEEGRLATGGEDLVYYHTGGSEGNVSMLDRFRRKGLYP